MHQNQAFSGVSMKLRRKLGPANIPLPTSATLCVPFHRVKVGEVLKSEGEWFGKIKPGVVVLIGSTQQYSVPSRRQVYVVGPEALVEVPGGSKWAV